MNTQPQIRSQQLAPLSQEHRDGTLFISRIRQAGGKISSERIRAYTLWFWKNHIKPHFFQEEKILLPYMPVDHPWAIKLKEDHAYIRDLILSLDQQADKQAFILLCGLIDEHVRFEEVKVFGYLEDHLDKKQLDAIFEELEHHPVDADEWGDAFWKE